MKWCVYVIKFVISCCGLALISWWRSMAENNFSGGVLPQYQEGPYM